MNKLILKSVLLISFILFIMCGCDKPIKESYIEKTEEISEVIIETTTEETTQAVSVEIAMIGDMLVHEGVYNSGIYPDGTYNYDHLFTHIKADVQTADIAILNQETILGGVELGLSGYPMFNSPNQIGDSIANAGFNVVLHATNHTLDKGLQGVENTLSFWKEKHPEIGVLGVNSSWEEYNNNVYVYEKEGLKIAILNYTYGTNGIPLPQGKEYIINLLDKDKILKDIEYAKKASDFIIVCPHWGTEYNFEQNDEQKEWAKFFADNGVNLVIGSHAHVIQPVEFVKGNDGNNMLVYYSLGNFVSNQDQIITMLGAMAKVTITNSGGNVHISKYGVEPLVNHMLFGKGLITTYKLSEYTDELAKQNKINIYQKGFSVEKLKGYCRDVFGDLYVE